MKSSIPTEARGAKQYTDDGAGGAAWYHVTPNGYQIATKRNSRAKATLRIVSDEREVIKIIEKFFEA